MEEFLADVRRLERRRDARNINPGMSLSSIFWLASSQPVDLDKVISNGNHALVGTRRQCWQKAVTLCIASPCNHFINFNVDYLVFNAFATRAQEESVDASKL